MESGQRGLETGEHRVASAYDLRVDRHASDEPVTSCCLRCLSNTLFNILRQHLSKVSRRNLRSKHPQQRHACFRRTRQDTPLHVLRVREAWPQRNGLRRLQEVMGSHNGSHHPWGGGKGVPDSPHRSSRIQSSYNAHLLLKSSIFLQPCQRFLDLSDAIR